MVKKYLSLDKLTEYDHLIKQKIDDGLKNLETVTDDKKDKDLIVTYGDSNLSVTHSAAEVLEAVNAGTTVKFRKDTELLNILEVTEDYATFYMLYVNMQNKLQQRIVVIDGNKRVMLEQDDTYSYATVTQLNNKQDKLTGTEGQVVSFNSNGTAVATNLDLITADDIDTICGASIQAVSSDDAVF